MQSFKIVAVGDGAVGKTTFLISFALDCFNQEYIPTVFDNFTTVYKLEDRNISLGLWDTAGQEDFATIRPLSYPNTDIFLVFYSVAMRPSYENVKAKWIPELQKNCPTVPFVLIGSQNDIRDKNNTSHVTSKEGKKLAKEVGAMDYYELSSKDNSTFRYVWDDILRFIINERRNGKEEGKHCWSIHCKDKLDIFSKVKCGGNCESWYCNDCTEHWEDGFKGCAQCILYEKEERTKNNKPIPGVKKKRVLPEEKIAAQLAEFTALYDKQMQKKKEQKEKELSGRANLEHSGKDHHKDKSEKKDKAEKGEKGEKEGGEKQASSTHSLGTATGTS